MREPTILREGRFESDVANGTSDSIDDGNPGDWEMPYLSGSRVRDDSLWIESMVVVARLYEREVAQAAADLVRTSEVTRALRRIG
jgi:hypothetical protein